MKVVVDTNVIFSALIAAGKTRDLILLEDLDLLIPEFFYNELRNNEKEIISKTSLTESEFSTLLNIFFEDVDVIPKAEFEDEISLAKDIMEDIDPDDVPFVALAMKKDVRIWSDDKHFQQQETVEVFRTEDLLEKFDI